MKRPDLTLSVDIEEDIRNVLVFFEYEKNQDVLNNFLPTEAKFLLNENIEKDNRKIKATEFVRKFYEENAEDINIGLHGVKESWNKYSENYYKYIEELFDGREWLSDKYRGVLSIFKMYSREIDRKLFFFPYKYDVERFSNRVIGHEMLHFMFFDFLFDRYQLRENSKLEGRPENYIWQLSEAFNSLVENNPLYMESIGIGYSGKPYIGQEGMIALMGEQFGKEKNIGKLLDKWIIGV